MADIVCSFINIRFFQEFQIVLVMKAALGENCMKIFGGPI